MLLDEKTYEQLVSQSLLELADYLENNQEWEDSDIELADNILTITLPNKRQYVINKQKPTREIWASSPFSGAHYFTYNNEQKIWLSRTSLTLRQLVDEQK